MYQHGIALTDGGCWSISKSFEIMMLLKAIILHVYTMIYGLLSAWTNSEIRD